MKFRAFLDMYNNWSAVVYVQDEHLRGVAKDTVKHVIKLYPQFWDLPVKSFGIFNNELLVTISID